MRGGVGKRKDRYADGVLLADNLYPDNQGRPGYWRYRKPDRSFKTFRARDVHEANEIAEDGNARRHLTQLDRTSMSYAVERYIVHAERLRPSMRRRESWKNRCYAMRAFARDEFPRRTCTERDIWGWWDNLTHSQQILREAEFRRMWTFFMRENLVMTDINPFDRDRLLRREKPVSARERLTIEDFWRIYAKARTGVQVAMGVSLLTTLRRGDVVAIERKHLQDGFLRVTVSKSEEQRGALRAARLEWNLEEHPDLARLLHRGLKGAPKLCPFVVNLKPRTYRKHGKRHSWQVLPDRLSKEFAKARKAAKVGGDNPPTFHEIRSLGSALLADQGEQLTDVMELMAHSDVEMTKLYQSGHPLPHQRIGVRINDVGGKW